MAAQESDSAKMARLAYEELERKFQDLLSPENQELARVHLEGARQSLSSLAQKGKEGLQLAIDLVSELTRELTEVEEFNVKPKSKSEATQNAELEIDIKIKKEKELPIKTAVAPLVEMEAVIVGKRIHFQAIIDKSKNGLRCNFNEGFALRLKSPLGKHTIAIKGTAILRRDENKQIVMETPLTIPGTQTEVSVSIPIKQLLHEAGKKSWLG